MTTIAPTAATVACLAALPTLLHHDGALWARLVLAAGIAAVLLLGVLAAPALPGAPAFALGGDERWRQARLRQLWAAGLACALGQWFFPAGVALMVGLVVALAVGAMAGSAESRDD